MKSGVVLLGGVIAAGKTTLAGNLVARHGFTRVATRKFLEERAKLKGLDVTRQALQRMGDELDQETGGVWVLDQIEAAAATLSQSTSLLLDSVRRDFQINRARERWPSRVSYVHLIVPRAVARERYDSRRIGDMASDQFVSFDEAKQSETEQHAETLAALADLVLDMDKMTVDAAADAVAANSKLLREG